MSTDEASITASEGKGYPVHESFQRGDLSIISGDRKVLKLNEAKLCEVSSVFRHMLSANTTGPKQVQLPELAAALAILLAPLVDVKVKCNEWLPIQSAIECCDKYDMPHLACDILFASVESLDPSNLFKAFAVASKKDDIRIGCRILGRAHLLRVGQGPFVPYDLYAPWDKSMSDEVRSSWVVALIGAMRNMERGGQLHEKCRDNQDYWTGIIGHFARFLTGGAARHLVTLH